MATKTLTITSGAYARLASLKGEMESFSDVINRITGGESLLSLAGVLSKEEATGLREAITETRKRLRRDVERTAARLA